MQKIFKFLCLNDFSQNTEFFIVTEARLVVVRFDLGLNPTALVRCLKMKVLDAHVPTVGLLQTVKNILHGHTNSTKIVTGKMNLTEIFGFKTQSVQTEPGILRNLILEGIKSTLSMANVPVGIDCTVESSVFLDRIISNFGLGRV